MAMRCTKPWTTAAASVLLGVPSWCSASEPPIDGAEEFRTHCAVCHGSGGHGDGPMAGQLVRRPTDLTLLSRNNGGSFPETVVYQSIDGRRIVLFHGSREMPVWGERFQRNDDEATQDARINALVRYVESLQTP
jgi:mono/diheme cytochrome c family protein